MKSLMPILLVVTCLIAGCSDQEPAVNAEKSVLNPEIEALKQAKQVDRKILEADAEHRRMMEERIDQGQ